MQKQATQNGIIVHFLSTNDVAFQCRYAAPRKYSSPVATVCRAYFVGKACLNQSINQFSGPAYPWGVAGAAAQVGASKHLDPLQQRIDALLGCQGETN